MKSELFSQTADVTFAEKDPSILEQEVISRYESITGRTLARGDPVRLFLDSVILALIQQRNVIDTAAKNNLLAYASGAYLDHLGALLGVYRLSASHAVCTVRFTLSAIQDFDVIIPEGIRVTPGDGVMFSTTAESRIPAGKNSCEVSCVCDAEGEAGNGYIAGQIKMLADVFPYEMKCENITAPTGGSDTESDENFRERIQIAPESFSSAGPANAYAYYARSAHPDIIDVAVMGPPDTEPGHVEIYPLMTGGELPSDENLEAVLATCSASDVRPDTDYVCVLRPYTVEFDLNVSYWINESDSANAVQIQRKVEEAADEWVAWQRMKLGRDINPSELTKRILLAGAKRCEIISPDYQAVKANSIGTIRNKVYKYMGLEEH